MPHEPFLHHCLSLAAKGGRGNCARVGSVLVRDGRVIAEGYCREYGAPHAERSLLESFHGDIASEDILYVNLEPCCHHGKTPPCTDIIIERSVKRVVYGMIDPDRRVSGKGIRILREAGIEVFGPVLLPLCERFNRGFVSVRIKGRPWITLKHAQTIDGRIANDEGAPLRITSEEQDQWSHRFLRATHDAILVGVQTIINDDPSLTVRYGVEATEPLRIVLDPKGRMPIAAKIVLQGTIVVRGAQENEGIEAIEDLRRKGARIFEVSMEDGHFVWQDLWDKLITPDGDFHGITSILVEGGARTWELFRSSGCIDEEVILVG